MLQPRAGMRLAGGAEGGAADLLFMLVLLLLLSLPGSRHWRHQANHLAIRYGMAFLLGS